MKPSVRPKQSREGETTAATATVAMVATKVKQQQSHRKSFRFLKALEVQIGMLAEEIESHLEIIYIILKSSHHRVHQFVGQVDL